MKKHKSSLLLLPVLVSLSCGNMHGQGNHNGLIAGMCAAGAALIGVAGVAAMVDWCSESDDQLIGRIGNEFHSIASQYQSTMDYFGPRAGIGIHAPHRPIHYIPEDVLYEFGTFVWNSGTSHADYRAQVWSAKHTLQSCSKDLRKRINALAGKYNSYEDQKRLATMKTLFNNGNQLLADIALFADCLEYHKTYFTLYDSLGRVYNRYLQHITILESGRYSVAAEIKNYVFSCDTSQYAFMNFVGTINGNIEALQYDMRSLKYNYDAMQRSTNYIIDQLVGIRNIVALDPRYQEELYQYEQVQLERQRIEALEAQARLERDRIRMERERNRLIERQIELERQRMYMQPVIVSHVPVEEISVTVTF